MTPGTGRPRAVGTSEPKPYTEILAILKSRVNVEAVAPQTIDAASAFSLERISLVLARLRNPHLDLRVVHVAGSKGKGSVCELTAAALRACGCSVGLYTSPHISDLRERIRVDSSPISEGDFARVIEEVIAAEKHALKGKALLTQFELLTAAAFVHFRRQAVDVAVIEVGLGGGGDATNVVLPAVCVITSIQKEHTQLLGETLPEIAAHKAGIIKDGVPTITLPQTNEVMRVLRQRCGEVDAPLEVLDHSIAYAHRYQTGADGVVRMTVSVECDGARLDSVPVPFSGEHQAFNTGLALAAAVRGLPRGVKVRPSEICTHLAAVHQNGRLEVVMNNPFVLADGAHTPDSLRATLRTLASHFRLEPLTVVFGCAADKDVHAMLRELAQGADRVVFTRAPMPRAASPDELRLVYSTLCDRTAQSVADPDEALSRAVRATPSRGGVLVTGSFSLVGFAREVAARREG
jgi:dihydrofolate synthase/folylpolyglutamate synthase